jgi:hypothetical protein
MVCPSAPSKAEARWLRFGLVVVATTNRRDNKDQMIRPLGLPRRIFHVFKYENVCQNPQNFQQTISPFPEHSTLYVHMYFHMFIQGFIVEIVVYSKGFKLPSELFSSTLFPCLCNKVF